MSPSDFRVPWRYRLRVLLTGCTPVVRAPRAPIVVRQTSDGSVSCNLHTWPLPERDFFGERPLLRALWQEYTRP